MDRSVAQELVRLDRRLEPVLEPAMRRSLVLEWLCGAPAEQACRVASAALDRPRSADALRRALAEVLTGATGTRLGEAARRSLYLEAASAGNEELMRLLRSVPAQDRLDEPERLLSRELAELPLGRRRALARGSHPHWLEQLAKDCDPVVIANLLSNPRTVEADVLRIAAMRPVAEAVLVEISRSPRWSSRTGVRKALARNPYCPVEIATGIVVTLPLEDLREMRGDPDLHPETLAQLAAELERRRSGPSSK
jgi:hypothetical protein